MYRLLLVLGAAFSCQMAHAIPDCPAGHCARVSVLMNKFCIENGLAGKKFLVFGPNNTECFCPCSCVTPETNISLSSRMSRIDQLQDKDPLFTPYTNDKESTLDKKMTSDVNDSRLIAIDFTNGSSLKASPNHTFITPDEAVITAEELMIGDKVLDVNRQRTEVSQKVEIKYTGDMLNVIVNQNSAKAVDHVIANNNILSGDWLLQSHNDSIEAGIAIRSGEIQIFSE
jgi:hypothetical protein